MNEFLREETTTGKLLLVATAVALLWANLAGDSYAAVWDTRVAHGPEWLELDLDLHDPRVRAGRGRDPTRRGG